MNLPNAFYYISALIGLMTLAIGVCAVLRPIPMATKFGVAATDSAVPYVISTGIRDVFIGLTILALFYLQEWFALGMVLLFVGLVALSDFRVVSKYGDRKVSYVHLAGCISVIVYGAWLLAKVNP